MSAVAGRSALTSAYPHAFFVSILSKDGEVLSVRLRGSNHLDVNVLAQSNIRATGITPMVKLTP